MTTEREALDLIRATATRSVPNCINLGAIDRILADVPAQPAPLADAELAQNDKGTTCRNCEHTDLTVDFGTKCPECGSQDLEHWVWNGRIPAEVLENLLARATAAYAGPYQVEITGSRRRFFKTNGGSNILRKLLSEFELEELTPDAAQRHRATDAYMAAADPQTVTRIVQEVLALRKATPAPIGEDVLAQAKQQLASIRINHPGGFVGFVPQEQAEKYVAGLLARLAAAEAHSATLQGALESSTDTNRVLAIRLKAIADALPTMLHYLDGATQEADKEEANDGYEALYNAANHVGTGLRKLLRELNPTVKGGQHNV